MTNEFQIRRDNFETFRVLESDSNADATTLDADEVRVRIERFAFTANNISYAATGDQLGYWQFFPPTAEADGWGMMPVWGFADVVQSNVDEVPVGERLFGYFPPASHLNLKPMHIGPLRLVDGAEHRAQLPQGYNTYYRVNAEPGYDPANDDLRMLLWPLHITSFFLWDFLQDADWFGAAQVIIVSASSKTSLGLAYALDVDTTAPPAVAITSARNLDFVKGLDLYTEAVSYDSLTNIDATIPSVIVDMSGNGQVLGKLHTHLGENMKRCINVGLTHWDEGMTGDGINKERSEFFFAPAHIQKRMQDWGPDGFAEKTSSFMQETALKSRAWLKLKRLDGLQGLADVYEDVCNGRLSPAEGLIIEL